LDSLPRLRQEAQAQLLTCKSSLEALPPLITVDPSTETLSRISDFSQQLLAMVAGLDLVSAKDNHSSKEFVQSSRESYQQFKKNIRATAPKFRAFEDHRKYKSHSLKEAEDEGSGSESESFPSTQKTRMNLTCGPFDLGYVKLVIKKSEFCILRCCTDSDYTSTRSIAWELPGNVPFDAKRFLMDKFTCLWDAPALACYEAVVKQLEQEIVRLVKEKFGRFPKLQEYMSCVLWLFSSLSSVGLNEYGL